MDSKIKMIPVMIWVLMYHDYAIIFTEKGWDFATWFYIIKYKTLYNKL